MYLEIHLESVPSGGTTCFQYFAVKKQHFTLIAYRVAQAGTKSAFLSQYTHINIVACNRAVMNNKNYCGKRHMTFPQWSLPTRMALLVAAREFIAFKGIVLKCISKCTFFTSKVTYKSVHMCFYNTGNVITIWINRNMERGK